MSNQTPSQEQQFWQTISNNAGLVIAGGLIAACIILGVVGYVWSKT